MTEQEQLVAMLTRIGIPMRPWSSGNEVIITGPREDDDPKNPAHRGQSWASVEFAFDNAGNLLSVDIVGD